MKTFDDGFYIKEFGELNGSDEGNDKLLMQGIVMGISEIEHYPNLAVVKCQGCRDEIQIHESDFKNWRNFKIPKECLKCGGVFDVIQFSKGNIRKFLFGEEKNANPITITAFLFKSDVYNVKPGEKIRINATLQSVKIGKSETWKRVLDVKQMTSATNKPKMPTDDELKMFKELDKQKLIDSFAPKIKGMDLIKEGLFIACLGGVSQENQRGDINTLLMGDPGVAKTQLLKFTASIVQKSDYTSGKSASQAGLLAGVDNLSDGTRIAKPGSVIMCNGGVCCIDEFEKMNASDRAGLHEVMENNTFSLRKIGINMTWEAKTAIFGAANPRGSKWDSELTIKENVNLPDSLLSRFGLIFLIRDIPNKETDFAIARHVRKIKQNTMDSVLEPMLLTKFINYAKTINPKISDDAADHIEQYWIDLRCQSQANGSILIDHRTLQDLYRLAEAYARMDLSEIVTKEHGKSAIKLLNGSLQTLGMATPGEAHQSMINYMNREQFLQFIFKDDMTESTAILRMMNRRDLYPDESRAEKDLNKLRLMGKIYEKGDKLSWV